MPANTPAVRDRVQRMLARLLGGVQVGADGEFSFPFETTRVFVRVDPWQDQWTVVSVYAITNLGVPPSPELYKFLATEDRWWFGHVSAAEEEDGTLLVTFRHTLLGDFLDPEELRIAVGTVAVTADEIDDEIRNRFGGQRVADL